MKGVVVRAPFVLTGAGPVEGLELVERGQSHERSTGLDPPQPPSLLAIAPVRIIPDGQEHVVQVRQRTRLMRVLPRIWHPRSLTDQVDHRHRGEVIVHGHSTHQYNS